MQTSGGWWDWVRAATRPRLIGIFVLLIVGALVCIRLGAWQLDRSQIRGDQAREIELAERENAAPVPLEEVVAPQTSFTQAMVGKRVSVRGTYDVGEQFFVPGRALDGQVGYLLLTGLRVTQGPATGAILPVVRGWVPEDGPAYLEGVPAPDVEVDVMGYLSGSEAADARGSVDGQLDAVSSAQLVNIWGSPMYSGHLVLAEQQPATSAPFDLPAIRAMSAPVIEGGGVNLQNLAYAAEWWIFGGFALVLWWRMVRDEVQFLRGEGDDGGHRPGVASPVGSGARSG